MTDQSPTPSTAFTQPVSPIGVTDTVEPHATLTPAATLNLVNLSTQAVSPGPSTPQVLTPSPNPVGEKSQYLLDVTFDYLAHHLSVIEVVELTNPGPEAYTDLAFQVEPNDHPGDITFKSISLADGKGVSGYTLDKNRLNIPLPVPLAPGQSSTVNLVYDLYLPAIPPPSDSVRPTIFGYTANQTNLVDWFPYLPVYQPGQGWLIHSPWFYGEHQVYPTADFEVNLTLANPPGGLVIAAAAPVRVDPAGIQHFQLRDARTFAWSASPFYKVSSQKAGVVEVTSYTFPIDQRAGQVALQNTVDAVTLYSNLFGPYQHTHLTVVEGDFLDGMEYDGLFFLSKGFYNLYEGTPKGYLTVIAVHETAHQWFFAQVGNDQALEPWLDEAFATYSEKLFYEHTYPDLVKWWWDFRVNYYSPTSWINQSIYDFKGFEPYRNAVYLHGAQFIDALRGQIGDEAFFAFIKDYVSKYQYRIATRQDFFHLLTSHTQQNLSGLIGTYFVTTQP